MLSINFSNAHLILQNIFNHFSRKRFYTKCNLHIFESKFSVLLNSDVSCDCNISIYTLYTPNGHFSFILSMAADFTRNL